MLFYLSEMWCFNMNYVNSIFLVYLLIVLIGIKLKLVWFMGFWKLINSFLFL